MSLSDREIERYSRQIIVAGGVAQERLRAARVAVIGRAPDAESIVYYLAGAGIGRLTLEVRGDAAATVRLFAHARGLNSNIVITIAGPGAPPHDVAAILADGFAVEALIEQLTKYAPSGCVIGANLAQGRIALLTSAPRCLRCVAEKLLSRSAPLDDNDDYSSNLVAMEVIRVLTNKAKPASSLIELEGYATCTRPIDVISPESCEHLFTGVEPRAWLFDFDNTLAALEREVDWAASRVELEAFLRGSGVAEKIFAAIPKGNLPLYEALRADLMGGGAGRAAAGGRARSAPHQLLRDTSARIEAHELRGAERAQELPGATALLRRLRRRSSAVAIVTSNASGAVRRWLERQRLADCVDTIVGRDAMLPLKPAPDSIYRALAILRTRAEDAVFVGDSKADIDAARAAGIRFIQIGPVHSSTDGFGGTNHLARLNSPQELLSKLGAASDP